MVRTVIMGIFFITLLTGCIQKNQKLHEKAKKQKVYTPMRVSKEVPNANQEHMIYFDKKDIEKYEKDQNNKSDFEKYIQEKERKF